jgi:hypothetical protein
MSEMYGGSSRDENGRITPKKDTDEGMDEQNDFDTKMRQYRERVPKHRGGGEQAERNIEAPARPRRRRQETPAREEPADNIAAEDMPEYDLPTSTPGTPIRAPRYTPTEEGGEDVDQKMLNAWLDNNPNEF